MSTSTISDWDRDAALTTARILLEINAIKFQPDEPFTFTSGWKSPVYIDCRRISSFPRARATISARCRRWSTTRESTPIIRHWT